MEAIAKRRNRFAKYSSRAEFSIGFVSSNDSRFPRRRVIVLEFGARFRIQEERRLAELSASENIKSRYLVAFRAVRARFAVITTTYCRALLHNLFRPFFYRSAYKGRGSTR